MQIIYLIVDDCFKFTCDYNVPQINKLYIKMVTEVVINTDPITS
jgi:hypothetical protein